MNLKQTEWAGFYSYERSRQDQVLPPRTEFRLRFQKHGFFRITGIIDDAPPGIPEQAVFRGWVWGNRICFSKFYRTTWICIESGPPETINDYVRRVTGGELSFKYPALPIRYSGSIQFRQGRMEGTWRLKGNGRIMLDCEGKWEATLHGF